MVSALTSARKVREIDALFVVDEVLTLCDISCEMPDTSLAFGHRPSLTDNNSKPPNFGLIVGTKEILRLGALMLTSETAGDLNPLDLVRLS